MEEAPARLMACVIAALLALRIGALIASPLELHFDEAQYWDWSRALAWGYFSKPPLIAWVIWAFTSVFGNAEWAVRLAAPIAHAFGAWALFLLGRRIYGAHAGVWAGLIWMTLPAVWLSSAIMSTDALAMPLWSFALYALWRLIETRTWVWAIWLGVAIGLGALAKYAMLYFPLCAGLAAIWSPRVRAAVLSPHGAAAGAIALLILAPNLAWNAMNSFATVEHTAANANLGGDLLHPEELLEFLGSQAGVVGPVLFVALGFCLFRAGRAPSALKDEDKFLLAFVLPTLIIILTQALISRAHANWAAAAYPAAIVWLSGRLQPSANGRRTLWAAFATQVLLGALIIAVGVGPALGDRIGLSDATKRLRGWRDTAQEITLRVNEGQYSAIVVDHRALYFELNYYLRDARGALPPIRMWVLNAEAGNHAEAAAPVRAGDSARVLVVHQVPRYLPFLHSDFERCTRQAGATIPLGGGETRVLAFSVCENFRPVPRDAAFQRRLDAS